MISGAGSPRGSAALSRHVGALVDGPPASAARFPDGAHFRIEIPSVENPEALRAVVERPANDKVPIHRTSQGSGAMLLTTSELAEMAPIGADEGLEVSLFVGPREEYGIGGVGSKSRRSRCSRVACGDSTNCATPSKTSCAPSTPVSGVS